MKCYTEGGKIPSCACDVFRGGVHHRFNTRPGESLKYQTNTTQIEKKKKVRF